MPSFFSNPMRAWLEVHKERRSLERCIANLNLEHQEALATLEHPTYQEREDLEGSFIAEERLYQDELRVLISNHLVSLAHRLFIPVPEVKREGGLWEQVSTTGQYYLTTSAPSELRSAIRRERKEKLEMWLLGLAACTGLVGAITGLIAVLLH